MTHYFDKAALLAMIGAVGGMCACLMIKNSIEQIINGSSTIAYPRLKGIVLLTLGLAALAGSLYVILNAPQVLQMLTSSNFLSLIPFAS